MIQLRQVSMMAYATESVMELLRSVDEGSPYLALISSECQAFADKVAYMWNAGGVLIITGYTDEMLKNMEVPMTYQMNGRLVTVCGISLCAGHPIVDACVGRMQCWLHLALANSAYRAPEL